MRAMLITGASRGIGAATARLAAHRGYAVTVNYARRSDAAEAVVAQIEAAGGRAIAVRADIADPAQIRALFAAHDEAFGRLDVLVNNAGILEPAATVETIAADRLARVFAVNVQGAFLCAGEAIRRMAPRHGGHGGVIVNLSSAAARLGSPFEYVDYAASKGAIDTMTIGLAKEVAGDDIRVNAVRPGLIHTDMQDASGIPDRIGKLKHAVPMQRGGTADEIAEAVIWLASDAASYVTGAILDVTGGR